MSTVEYPNEVETHCEATLLSVALQQAKKRYGLLMQSIEETETANGKLSSKEFEFRVTECARLENIGKLQQKVDDYRAASLGKKPRELEAEAQKSGNSHTLGLHLTSSGQFKPNSNWEAHHIVCSRHPSHAASRLILYGFKYGINDPHNGCWLPRKHRYAVGTSLPNAVGHRHVHTLAYANFVNRRLLTVATTTELNARLSSIRSDLQDTINLDKQILTKKGNDDLRISS